MGLEGVHVPNAVVWRASQVAPGVIVGGTPTTPVMMKHSISTMKAAVSTPLLVSQKEAL